MFGLSIGKILLVLAAVVVLLAGSKLLRRVGRSGDGAAGGCSGDGSAADLIQCRACGAFAAGNCGKPGCPLV